MVFCKVRGATGMNHLTHPLLACHWLDHAYNNGWQTPRHSVDTLFPTRRSWLFDDFAALSTKYRCYLQEKTDRLNRFAKQTGLNINISKTKVICINATPDAPITADGEPLDFVEEITYLGSLVERLGKASGAFAQLQPVWRLKHEQLWNEA